jgi:protein-tyrosine-phosphatase
MKHVLFVCTHNAGRSQMAQAFFERQAPPGMRAESAGSEPAREVWPAAVEVMREVGIDIAGRRPRMLTREMQLRADWAVTMGCGDACPYVPTIVEEWDIPDPAGRPLDEVRAIRDLVEDHVARLIAGRLGVTRRAPHASDTR